MTSEQVLSRLKRAGTAQNRKVYARHGVQGPQFGVSYAELGKLAREIKIDTDLAVALWESGNHDARILATMIIDPADCSASRLDAWVREIDNYPLTDAFSRLVAQTGFVLRKADQWSRNQGDFIGQAGWNLIGALATDERCSDKWLETRLGEIEETIATRSNRTRHAMNGALICIGIARSKLRDHALRVAAAISPVEVDHGETGCKTPDATAYIHKALTHRGNEVRKHAANRARRKAR